MVKVLEACTRAIKVCFIYWSIFRTITQRLFFLFCQYRMYELMLLKSFSYHRTDFLSFNWGFRGDGWRGNKLVQIYVWLPWIQVNAYDNIRVADFLYWSKYLLTPVAAILHDHARTLRDQERKMDEELMSIDCINHTDDIACRNEINMIANKEHRIIILYLH